MTSHLKSILKRVNSRAAKMQIVLNKKEKDAKDKRMKAAAEEKRARAAQVALRKEKRMVNKKINAMLKDIKAGGCGCGCKGGK